MSSSMLAVNWKYVEGLTYKVLNFFEWEIEYNKACTENQVKGRFRSGFETERGKNCSREARGEGKVTEEACSDGKQERADQLDTHWADSVLSASPPVLWKSSCPPWPLHTFPCLRYQLFPSPLSERASSMSLHFLPVSVTEPDPRAHTEDSNTAVAV